MTHPLSHHHAKLDGVTLHYVVSGRGPAVVLLHGWPQTWYEWRHIIPALAERYTVIAPDLRGLGDSSRPETGYDKKTVANDVWQLVNGKLGHERFFVVGHDWGGPTAYALAAAHPEAVTRLAILDVVIPGDGGDFSQGGRRWHHQFHLTPDLPEALTEGRERLYLSWFYRTFGHRPDAISEADIDEYLRTYTQPGAMRAGLCLLSGVATGCGRQSRERRTPQAAHAGACAWRSRRAWSRARAGRLPQATGSQRAGRGRRRMRPLDSGGAAPLSRGASSSVFCRELAGAHSKRPNGRET